MQLGMRAKLTIAFELMIVIPMLILFSVGNSKVGIQNASELILAQGILLVASTSIVSDIIFRSVLKPLDELHRATDRIMDGDLDYEIHYRKDNEMGKYCMAFERMRVQLKESLQKQTALEQSRRELISSISHDLRTPLSSIRGYVEGLSDGVVRDEEKFRRYITVIKNKTESLDSLIESLFQYSQMDFISQKETVRACDSAELLEDIIGSLEVEFVEDEIDLTVIRPFPSVRVFADEGRIAQVFSNIISNARRYVDNHDVITIRASIEGDCLRISIADTGSGIPPEDLPHVFEQFYRAEKSRSSHFGGLGLGLAICRKIVEGHGGEIWVESTPNVMTDFSFTLPISS